MITISNTKDFNVITNMISEVVKEVDISFLIDEMVVRAVHITNSNILSVKIKKEFFKKYNVEKDVTYTISLEDLNKILRICEEDVKINPTIDFLEIKSGRKKFKLAYFIGRKDERDNPNFNHTININLPTKVFYNVVKDALGMDAIGELCIDDNLFYLKSNSPKIKSELNFTNYKFLAKENGKAFYDLSLLVLSSKLENIFWDISVRWNDDSPLEIDGENNLIKCKFILANRVAE